MSDSQKRNGLVLMTTPEKKKRKPFTKKRLKEINDKKKARAAAPKTELDDIKNLEEPVEGQVFHKPKGRPKSEHYLSYEEAREFVRNELIPSRSKYLEWWERNKPKAIPRFPYRLYKDKWTSWNDWLGNNNEFSANSNKNWRPFDDAVQWAQKQKIESYYKWLEFFKEHRENIPPDIPSRPDLVYPAWRTWNHWLGNTAAERVIAAQDALRNQIFFVIHDPSVPENVFTFGVEPGGQFVLKERWEREKFNIIRLFWYDPALGDQVKKIVNSLSTPYLDNEKQRICQNVWEILWYLSMLLENIRSFK